MSFIAVVIFLLWVCTTSQSLEVQHSIFDICEFNPPVVANMECINEPPCKFCVKILSQNSVYRVADIITHSGLKWESDSRHILEEDEYQNTFLYNVLETNGLTSGPEDNIRKLRDVILQRAESVLTAQDKSYMRDDNTIIVYLRVGDRIDHVPMTALIHQIRESKTKRVVLSFVMHFGQWTEEDIKNYVGPTPLRAGSGLFTFTDHQHRENYVYIWDVVQSLRKAVPGIEIIIRSNEKQDEDLALYVKSPNYAGCALGGFERLIMNLRNTSVGILEKEVDSALAARGISKTWIQFGKEEKEGGPENGSAIQYMILLSLGWLLYGYDGVIAGYAHGTWRNTPMGNVDKNILHKGKLSLSTTHLETAIRDAFKSTNVITMFSSIRPTANTGEQLLPRETSEQGDILASVNIAYMQNYDDLIESGVGPQVDQYIHKVFNLTHIVDKNNVLDLKRWLELMSITQRCCGSSMEYSWREALHALNQAPLISMPQNTHSCQLHNFSSIEEKLDELEAALFQIHLSQIGSCDCSIDLTINGQLNSSSFHYRSCQGYRRYDIFHPENYYVRQQLLTAAPLTPAFKFRSHPIVTALPNRSLDRVDLISTLQQMQLESAWVQYGRPNNLLSGMQFMAMNAFAWYLFGFENVDVGPWQDFSVNIIKHNNTSNSSTALVEEYPSKKETSTTTNNKPRLVVTHVHSLENLEEVNHTLSRYSLFVSTSSEVKRKHVEEIENLRASTKNLAFIQRHDDALHNNFRASVDVYGELFNVTDTAVTESINKWLSLWRLSQICCSHSRMSEEWRSTLLLYKRGRSRPSPSIPPGTHMCQQYDFALVEVTMREVERFLFGEVLTKIGSCACFIDQLQQADAGHRTVCEKSYLDEILADPREAINQSTTTSSMEGRDGEGSTVASTPNSAIVNSSDVGNFDPRFSTEAKKAITTAKSLDQPRPGSISEFREALVRKRSKQSAANAKA